MSTQAGTETTSQSDVSADPTAPSSEQSAGQTQPTEGGDESTEGSTPALGTEPAEQKEGAKPAAGTEGQAPESYEFTSPEGQENITQAVHDRFADAARKLNLTNEGAQSLLDAVFPGIQEAARGRLAEARAQWHEEAKQDKLVGGDAFKTNLAVANRAFDAFGDDELRGVLETSGLGNHPAVLRMFFRAGSKISEDTLVTGGRPPKEPANLRDPEEQARRLYPEAT